MKHRMDSTNPFSIMNHNLMAGFDSQDNIHVMWVEKQENISGETLKTLKFMTATDTWESTVMDVAASNIMLNKVVSGVLSHSSNGNMVAVIHEQDGAGHKTFSLLYDSTANTWATATRVDSEVTGTNQISAPTIARNMNGDLMVAWVETMAGMTANNMSGLMNMIAVKRYMPGMGWHGDVEQVAHVAMDSDAAGVEVALNNSGDASVIWKEASNTSTNIIASHLISSNAAWSQKELIKTVPASNGLVMDLAIILDQDNLPTMLWTVKQSDAANDTFTVERTQRLSAIADATVGSGGNTGGTGGNTNTGNTNDGVHPANLVWSVPVQAIDSMQMGVADLTLEKEPQLVMDLMGNTTIKFTSLSRMTTNNVVTKMAENEIYRSNDGVNWTDTLATSALFTDLSTEARMETIQVVANSGNLYSLIRDVDKLYLARYVESFGWNKIEIPEVPFNTPSENLQIANNKSGMVTVVWIQTIPNSFNVNINAKHYMDGNWEPTQSITVAFEKILSPHYIDENGNIYATWLVGNASSNTGLYDVKMASYTPMNGWSEVSDGPQGIRSVFPNTVTGGHHKVLVDADDYDSHTIDAYVIRHDGTWQKFPAINDRQTTDQVLLANRDDIKVVIGENGQFVISWSEVETNSQVLRFMTATAHIMPATATTMEMIHWTDPVEVGGMNMDIESGLEFVITNTGEVYAVWVGDLKQVYVNHADSTGQWDNMPTVLADYSDLNDTIAYNPRITLGGQGKIGIAWDQYSKSSAMVMHKIWVVQSN